MPASASRPLLVLMLLFACGEPAHYRFGENVTGLRFTPKSETEGIHPDTSVLLDPDNPFRNGPMGPQTKWQMLESGGSVASFYAFATSLVREPTGENQFYAAQGLGDIAGTNSLSSPDQHDEVVLMAIAGYQSMLDHFPDAISYDSTGTTSFRLATPAYKAIVALGGRVQGGWVLVSTPDGDQAIRSADTPVDGGP